MTRFDGVVAGLLRGLLRGLNPHLVKVLVCLRGLRGSKLLFLFLLLLFAGLSRGFSHTMQNATNYLKCFEYLNPADGCNYRLVRVMDPVATPSNPVATPSNPVSGGGEFWGIRAESESE